MKRDVITEDCIPFLYAHVIKQASNSTAILLTAFTTICTVVFKLKGNMGNFKAFVKERIHLIVDRPGFRKHQIFIQLHMRFHVYGVVCQTPNMNVVDLLYARNCFETAFHVLRFN